MLCAQNFFLDFCKPSLAVLIPWQRQVHACGVDACTAYDVNFPKFPCTAYCRKAEASRESGYLPHQQTASTFEELHPHVSFKYDPLENGSIRLIEILPNCHHRGPFNAPSAIIARNFSTTMPSLISGVPMRTTDSSTSTEEGSRSEIICGNSSILPEYISQNFRSGSMRYLSTKQTLPSATSKFNVWAISSAVRS